MLKAKDIMTRELITVLPDMAVEDLAALLWQNRINGTPVVDADNNLVGVVTESDLIDQTKRFHIPTVVSILDSVIFLDKEDKIEMEVKKMTGKTVADICTNDPVTIEEQTQVDEIASIMAEKKVHTLPVLTKGKLVGLVGKADIIRTMSRRYDGKN